ncbi:hypothetical protein IGI04_015593 [Brassica rapa subsp. trilocularis]|uniref:Thioredoxin-like fold domain-containing protein n=1 Tax=Brassica rapa subsp. trilocularis TaxID=1813537 RepID=A0ABQ7MTH3_BRACM|nr:hypothetical protein IGI04_015593 [Brassica rapa subsp. trilocularis]
MTTVENMSSVPASEDTEFGFKRPEMYSTNIANSITSYGRHVFVLYKTPEAWISHVEEEGLPQRFATLLKDRKSDLLVQSKLNVCEGGGSDGDVLIFPDMVRYNPDSAGKISGNWYGYVTPDDVPELLDQHIAKGEIIQRIWRGQMGLSEGVAEKEHEQRVVPNGNPVVENFTGGCCQGANGSVSCCQNENPKPEPVKKEGKCAIWFQPLDKEEMYLGAAVVGAVATIAMIGYTFFKRSG